MMFLCLKRKSFLRSAEEGGEFLDRRHGDARKCSPIPFPSLFARYQRSRNLRKGYSILFAVL